MPVFILATFLKSVKPLRRKKKGKENQALLNLEHIPWHAFHVPDMFLIFKRIPPPLPLCMKTAFASLAKVKTQLHCVDSP